MRSCTLKQLELKKTVRSTGVYRFKIRGINVKFIMKMINILMTYMCFLSANIKNAPANVVVSNIGRCYKL